MNCALSTRVVGHSRSLLLAIGVAVSVWLPPQATSAADEIVTPAARAPVDFNRDIRPLLSENCFSCHGPDSAHREADLRLDQEQAAKGDREGSPVVVAGDSAASELITRIESVENPMPPVESGKSLDASQKALLRRWIDEGAVWSQAWTYVKPTRHPVPKSDSSSWPLNWIDQFVLHRLEQEQLAPSSDADSITLLRRLHFDLIGLPPTPTEVRDFLADESPDAYEKVVDRLLSSTHFGERIAIYWLDLVRFADTVGYHGDQPHNIWPYRDYVIHAFASNMPFDQFTREQLAGDLLPDASIDQQIASGYNRLLQTSHEGGVQLKEYRAIYLADRVRNVSQVWMGATLGCAQCHDHKYDPLSAEEFYALGAFFADIDDEAHIRGVKGANLNALPSPRPPEIETHGFYQRQRLAELQEAIKKLDGQADHEQLERLQAERKLLQQSKSLTMVSAAMSPREVRLLPRGNWLDESGPVVTPRVPAAFGELRQGADSRATRLDLAKWLTDPQGAGGFTARVMVNRFWYLLFGDGIARVLDDFGGQGEPPTHPELLDNLAVEFLESGWDVKHMIKLLVMSHTYRQSSLVSDELRAKDPENRLFARQARYRLPAEVVRDTLLEISGLLENEIGGPSVRPYQPPGLYRHLNFPVRKYEPQTDKQQWRRALYIHWQRQFLHPVLKAFDAPSREECTAQRPRSNTPLAALVLLNDPSFLAAARELASSTLDAADGENNPASLIDQMFLRAISRPADAHEHQILTDLLQSQLGHYRQHPEAAGQLLERKSASPRLAAWTSVARAVLNLSESVSRN